MAFSRVVKVGDGSATQFTVNFALGYISESDVKCRVGTEADGGGNPVYRTITFLSSSLLQISGAAPATGVEVVFERTVAKDSLVVNFNDGDTLTALNIDNAQRQSMMATHEALDGRDTLAEDLDADGNSITNLRDPVNNGDAVSKGWLNSTALTKAPGQSYYTAANQRITLVSTPVDDTDAANKAYVISQNGASVAAAAQSASDAAIARAAAQVSSDLATSKAAAAAADLASADAAVAAAVAARDAAIAAASSGSTTVIPTRAAAAALNPASPPDAVVIGGYYTAGDKGGGLYKKVTSDPGHPASVQMASGTWYELAEPIVNFRQFGAKGDWDNTAGTGQDATTAWQAFITYLLAKGVIGYVPKGDYMVSASTTFSPTTGYDTNGQQPGIRIYGDGMDQTTFYTNGTGVTVLQVQSNADSRWLRGGWIRGISCHNYTGASNVGILLYRCYKHTIEDCRFLGLAGASGYGIHIYSAVGDADASNSIVIIQCQFDVCTWGIYVEEGTAHNEQSVITVAHCFFWTCGNSTTVIGGGMRWKGQSLMMTHCEFTECQNRCLYIDGGAGVGSNLGVYHTTFENPQGKAVECYGIRMAVFDNIQLYIGAVYTCTNGLYFAGGTDGAVTNIHVRSAKVRLADAQTTFTAFLSSGTFAEPGTCRLENILYEVWPVSPLSTQIKVGLGWSTIETPVVYADYSTATALTIGTAATVIKFDHLLDDFYATYNTSTGTFTAPADGVYQFDVQVTISNGVSGDSITINFVPIIGAGNIRSKWCILRAANESISSCRRIRMVKGDTVQVQMLAPASRTLAVPNGNFNSLTILKVST